MAFFFHHMVYKYFCTLYFLAIDNNSLENFYSAIRECIQKSRLKFSSFGIVRWRHDSDMKGKR
jgi:hypothetical protein